MDGFSFIILLFLLFASSMLFMIFFITFNLKNKRLSVYLTAITATLSAWFAGLVLDANIRFGEPAGFLSFRILLPILAMGLCILNQLMRNRPD